MTVKRLAWEECDAHNCRCDIVESKDGDMVNYDDYAKLKEKYDSLLKAEHQLSESYVRIRQMVGEMNPPSTEPDQLYAYVESMVSSIGKDRNASDGLIAWESTTTCYVKYVTDKRYQGFSDAVKKWYKPYKCSNCAAGGSDDSIGGVVNMYHKSQEFK